MRKWIIEFDVLISELKEDYDKEIPDLPISKLLDWLVDELKNQFLRQYPTLEFIESDFEDPDGVQYFGIRMMVESAKMPQIVDEDVKFFNMRFVHPYEMAYDSSK